MSNVQRSAPQRTPSASLQIICNPPSPPCRLLLLSGRGGEIFGGKCAGHRENHLASTLCSRPVGVPPCRRGASPFPTQRTGPWQLPYLKGSKHSCVHDIISRAVTQSPTPLSDHAVTRPTSSTMVLPKTLRCYSSYSHYFRSDLVREAKTGVRGQGPDGLTPHSMGGIRTGHWARPGRVSQSRTVGPILDLTGRRVTG